MRARLKKQLMQEVRELGFGEKRVFLGSSELMGSPGQGSSGGDEANRCPSTAAL